MKAQCFITIVLIDSIEKLGLEPITQLLKTHGYWPMTYSNWSSRKFDWRNSSIAIRLSSGDGFLFELYNSLDTNNTDASVLYVIYGLKDNNNNSPALKRNFI